MAGDAPLDASSTVAEPPPPTRPATSYDTPVVVTPQGRHEPTFAAATRTVRVPVSVVDPEGEPVTGLGESDFRVVEDGRPQSVTLFSSERRPLRLVLALDTSKSMASKAGQVKEALEHFIHLLEPADEVLVMTFGDRVSVAQEFTSDRGLLANVLGRLRPAGGTALYDAASEAVRRVAPGEAEAKAVVLVTDGVDTASSVAFRELREQSRRSEVPVFSIGLDSRMPAGDASRPRRPLVPGYGGWPGGGRWPGGLGGRPRDAGPGGRFASGRGRLDFDEAPLEQLADDTGARVEIVRGLGHEGERTPAANRLERAVESIAMTLRHRYLLGYEPPEGERGWREIRVEVDRPALTAFARKGYYAGG
jgi:VWFA-related protein